MVSVAIICAPLGHAACLTRSAARSRAEAARGLPVTSSLSGRSAPLVSRRNCGAAAAAGTGRPGGVWSAALRTSSRLTMRSSSEWYASTTTRPPTASMSSAAGSARRSVPSSSFTSIRSAWKVRLAGLPPGAPGGRGDGVLDDDAEPLGRGDGGASALADHRLGDPPGEPLLAVLVQDAGELGGRVAVDDVGGGALGGPVHPHVQRGVLGVGEATRGVVQLRG